MNGLNAQEILALANLINGAAKKVAQQDMAPTGLDKKGNIEKTDSVDFTIRVTGDMGRAEDTDKASTCSIPLLATVAVLLRNMGCTRDAAVAKITEAMQDAMAMDKKAQKALLADMGVAKAEADFKREVVEKLPRTDVLGKVAHDLTFTKVG